MDSSATALSPVAVEPTEAPAIIVTEIPKRARKLRAVPDTAAKPDSAPVATYTPAQPYTLPSAFLRGMLEWVCEDATRFHLCGVHFHGVHAVATDGHTLVRASVLPEAGRDGRKYTIPSESLRAAVKAAGARGTVEIATSGPDERGIVHGDLIATPKGGAPVRIAWKSIDASFPPYDQVIPSFDANPDASAASCEKSAKRCAGVGMNPRYLARMIPVVAAYEHKGDRAIPVVLRSATGPLDPLAFTAHVPLDDKPTSKLADRRMITFVIMPMRTE